VPVGRSVLTGKQALAAGQRDKRVTIQQRSAADAKGASGRPVESWTTLGIEWMSKRPMHADERFAAEQESSYGEDQWVMPYRADMDPELVNVPKLRRLSYASRVYDIVTASIVGTKLGIELVTTAQTG
jgi:head-tail adaptor